MKMDLMDPTGVFVLFLLLEPVSCTGVLNEPLTCYILDGVLILYCIAATALYIREKFTHCPSVAIRVSEDESGRIYQVLERPNDADPYEVLEPTKRKKKAAQKKRSQSNQAEKRDKESLTPSAPAPPLSPR